MLRPDFGGQRPQERPMLRWSAFLLIVSHYQKQLLNQAKILV
jgi:hypothetical protein